MGGNLNVICIRQINKKIYFDVPTIYYFHEFYTTTTYMKRIKKLRQNSVSVLCVISIKLEKSHPPAPPPPRPPPPRPPCPSPVSGSTRMLTVAWPVTHAHSHSATAYIHAKSEFSKTLLQSQACGLYYPSMGLRQGGSLDQYLHYNLKRWP